MKKIMFFYWFPNPIHLQLPQRPLSSLHVQLEYAAEWVSRLASCRGFNNEGKGFWRNETYNETESRAVAAAGWPRHGQDKVVGQGNAIQDIKYACFSAFLNLLPTSRADIYNLDHLIFAIWLLIESWYQETWEEIWRQEGKKMVRYYSPQLPPCLGCHWRSGQVAQLLWPQLSLGFGNTVLFIAKAAAPSGRTSVAAAFPR